MPAISRRRLPRHAAGGAAALVLARWPKAAESATPPAAAARKPNSIFILFDDLGYGEPPGFWEDSPFKFPPTGAANCLKAPA